MKKTKINCPDLGERDFHQTKGGYYLLPAQHKTKSLGIQNTIAHKENSTETEGKVQSLLE